MVGLAGMARCATGPAPTAPVLPPTVPTAEVAGQWQGTTRVIPCDVAATRCDAVNNIRFTLIQDGSQLGGRYACSAGTMSCRRGGADDSGQIDRGSISGNRINLSVTVTADLSNCYYSGSTSSPTQASGVYVCYQRGNLIEEGIWEAFRTSADEPVAMAR
jgi:hypothetical protein